MTKKGLILRPLSFFYAHNNERTVRLQETPATAGKNHLHELPTALLPLVRFFRLALNVTPCCFVHQRSRLYQNIHFYCYLVTVQSHNERVEQVQCAAMNMDQQSNAH